MHGPLHHIARSSPDPAEQSTRAELLKAYPPKVARKRGKADGGQRPGGRRRARRSRPTSAPFPASSPSAAAPTPAARAWCSGPTRDIVNITHGPIGCGFYSWLTRRNQTRPPTGRRRELHPLLLLHRHAGGGDHLRRREEAQRQAIQEAYDLFHPKAIAIFSTCPVGLIGDDVHAVAREMKEKLGINVFGFSCEGYKGVSQSAGHHIANNQLFKHVIGLDDTPRDGQVQGQHAGRIQHRRRRLRARRIFERCGITLLATFSGNSTYGQVRERPHRRPERGDVPPLDQLRGRHDGEEVRHSVVQGELHRRRQPRPRSLRKIAEYFDDAELTARVEQVIAEEMAAVRDGAGRDPPRAARARRPCSSSAAPGPTTTRTCSRELGMKTMAAGYEFAHRDDYEGRRVLPTHQGGRRQPQHRGAARRARSRALPPAQRRRGDGQLAAEGMRASTTTTA